MNKKCMIILVTLLSIVTIISLLQTKHWRNKYLDRQWSLDSIRLTRTQRLTWYLWGKYPKIMSDEALFDADSYEDTQIEFITNFVLKGKTVIETNSPMWNSCIRLLKEHNVEVRDYE